VFEHHRKTIDNLKRVFEGNDDYLAFIVHDGAPVEFLQIDDQAQP
jgi:hypothetical protein